MMQSGITRAKCSRQKYSALKCALKLKGKQNFYTALGLVDTSWKIPLMRRHPWSANFNPFAGFIAAWVSQFWSEKTQFWFPNWYFTNTYFIFLFQKIIYRFFLKVWCLSRKWPQAVVTLFLVSWLHSTTRCEKLSETVAVTSKANNVCTALVLSRQSIQLVLWVPVCCLQYTTEWNKHYGGVEDGMLRWSKPQI